jgi:hypothetical protein
MMRRRRLGPGLAALSDVTASAMDPRTARAAGLTVGCKLLNLAAEVDR